MALRESSLKAAEKLQAIYIARLRRQQNVQCSDAIATFAFCLSLTANERFINGKLD
jgi:hypothetical protein